MRCSNCGNEIPDNSAFCTSCGAPVTSQPMGNDQSYQQPQQGAYQQPQGAYQQPQGGYQQPQQGDYNQPYQQGGYQQPQGGYNQPYQQGGYQQPQGGYNQPYQQGGYQQPQGGYNQPYQQPQVNYGGSKVDFQGVVSDLKTNIFKTIGLVGAILIFLSSFLPGWVYAKYGSDSESAGLFAEDGGILKLYGILLLIISLAMIVFALSDFIRVPAIKNFAQKFNSLPFSAFYLPAASLILFFLATFNSNFRDVIDAINEIKDMYSSWMGSSSDISGGYGYAFWFCLIGIILTLVPAVMSLINKNKNTY